MPLKVSSPELRYCRLGSTIVTYMKTQLAPAELLQSSWRVVRSTATGKAVAGRLHMTSHRLVFEPSGFTGAALWFGWEASLLTARKGKAAVDSRFVPVVGGDTSTVFRFRSDDQASDFTLALEMLHLEDPRKTPDE